MIFVTVSLCNCAAKLQFAQVELTSFKKKSDIIISEMQRWGVDKVLFSHKEYEG